MKKLFAVLMAIAMVVSMAACAAPAETEAAPSADVEMKYMTADETEAVLGNTDYVIVDVRKAADYAEGHIPGSVSVDMDAAVNGDTAAGEAAMKAALLCLLFLYAKVISEKRKNKRIWTPSRSQKSYTNIWMVIFLHEFLKKNMVQILEGLRLTVVKLEIENKRLKRMPDRVSIHIWRTRRCRSKAA